MTRSDACSWRIHSSAGRGSARRRPVSGSLMNRRLFQIQTPPYFSFRRMTRIDETAHPRRWGPRLVSWAGKCTPARFSAKAMACMLCPAA
jgi:hypothetical protein